VALAALAALAGCSDEREEFRDDLRPLEQRAEEEQSVTSGLLRSLQLGSREDARAVRAQAADLAAVYDEIAEIEPPGDYSEAFATYVSANRAAVEDLRRLAEEVEASDLDGVREASNRVLADLGRANTSSLKWLE
jgi:hypothetical protein